MGDVPERVAQQLAAVMHTANDGEDCNCHAAAREEFEVCAEVALTWLAERGLQAATPDGPRRWALPDEPGPEVTAVRGGSGTIYRRVGPHWQDGAHRVVESWWEILADGPLTDATPAADGQDGRDGVPTRFVEAPDDGDRESW